MSSTADSFTFLTRQEKDMASLIAERLSALITPVIEETLTALGASLADQIEQALAEARLAEEGAE